MALFKFTDKSYASVFIISLSSIAHSVCMINSIYVTVQYDEELAKITGMREHIAAMSEGATFLDLLLNVFIDHPEIDSHFPAGKLGFLLEGAPPKTYTPLFDGDVVSFSVHD